MLPITSAQILNSLQANPKWQPLTGHFYHRFISMSISTEEISIQRIREIYVLWRDKTERDGERGRGRQTKIDLTSHSYFRSFDSYIFRSCIRVCGNPKLWHSENISQTSKIYFRIILQEISPHTASEVMTHQRVQCQSRTAIWTQTLCSRAQRQRCCIFFFSSGQKREWWMLCDELSGHFTISVLFWKSGTGKRYGQSTNRFQNCIVAMSSEMKQLCKLWTSKEGTIMEVFIVIQP